MALIKCPECQTEISDKVKACPHCGYPLVDESLELQQVAVTAVKIESNGLKKKKTAIAVGAIVLLAFITIVISINRGNAKKAAAIREEYIDNLKLAHSTMLFGAADSEKICNLTKAVWYNTIRKKSDAKTDAYTKTGYNFNSDFNTSLVNLYSDPDILESVQGIKDNQGAVAEIMKSLQNPTDEFRDCYETVNDMYDIYQSFTNLAISPSGSLNDYAANFSSYDDDFMIYYNKLDTQIPQE